MASSRVGIWLVGAKGGVASTAILGLAALRKGLVGPVKKGTVPEAHKGGQSPFSPPVGLVTELPQFGRLELADWDRFVVAGHEIRRVPLMDEVLRMARESRQAALPGIAEQCRAELEEIDARIRPGTVLGVGTTIAALADWGLPPPHPFVVPASAGRKITAHRRLEPAEAGTTNGGPAEAGATNHGETPGQAIARLGRDMAEFVRGERLGHLVVVNVASTEPRVDASELPATWGELERLIADYAGDTCEPASGCNCLPASSLYAIAALAAGHSYVNFTPSLGAAPAAIDELARLRRACHYGCDGKTGETLMKSVLAPMFARRNLQVLSWVGHNIFGNMDGQVLDDPANKQAKVASKDHLLREILGYRPNSLVSIEYLPDLGDWKTAWDHIHFAGFLGVPMTLQFTWQGCDSLLAAPLVLDLVRLAELAHRRGHAGQMPFLASFFKSPYGVSEHSFERQFEMLEQWAAECEAASGQ